MSFQRDNQRRGVNQFRRSNSTNSIRSLNGFNNTNEEEPDAYTKALYQGNTLKTFSESSSVSVQELFKNVHGGIDFKLYNDIPVECSSKVTPITTFDATNGIHELILKNIVKASYVSPTPVQKYAIPIGLSGKDLMACAQTGSGKTAAFLVPVLTRILQNPPPARTLRKSYPQFLIFSPTRELAIQIYKEALKFSYNTWIRPAVVYGGAPIRSQLFELERGVDVLVATPGRLEDVIARGKVSLSKVKYLCFDEADRMLDMGFEKDIRRLVETTDMAGVKDRITTMFSATFPPEIRKMAKDFMNDYIFLSVGRVGSTVESITQVVKQVEDENKRQQLLVDIKANPGRTLVFAETKKDTDKLARYLFSCGLPCTGIHGDRTQHEREAALASFKNGRLSVLVATDVASRGLDISDVVHVINFDMPNSIDSYIHRIGRTGRVGQKGLATSYYNESNILLAKELIHVLKDAHQNVPEFLMMDAVMKRGRRGSRNGRGGGGARSRSGRMGAGKRKHAVRSEPYRTQMIRPW